MSLSQLPLDPRDELCKGPAEPFNIAAWSFDNLNNWAIIQLNSQPNKQLSDCRKGSEKNALRAEWRSAHGIAMDEHLLVEQDHEHDATPGVRPADNDTCQRAAAIFRALGDSNRLKLLSVLVQHELCVSELTAILHDNLPAVSQRLKLLRSERIVAARRDGKHVYYRLVDQHVRELITNGLEHGQEDSTLGEKNDGTPQP